MKHNLSNTTAMFALPTPLWDAPDDAPSGGTVLGGDITPATGDDTAPATGDDTAAATGDDTVPADGDDTAPATGDDTVTAEGDDTISDAGEQVPEDGVYEFELPEGVEISEADTAFWSKEFKELGLDRNTAQKLVGLQSQQRLAEMQGYVDAAETQQAEHLAAAKNDPEIGGDNWDATVANANKGLAALGGNAIKDLIVNSGQGNNPEMLRELSAIGKLFNDDKFEGGTTHEAPKPAEQSWYGETTPSTKTA